MPRTEKGMLNRRPPSQRPPFPESGPASSDAQKQSRCESLQKALATATLLRAHASETSKKRLLNLRLLTLFYKHAAPRPVRQTKRLTFRTGLWITHR